MSDTIYALSSGQGRAGVAVVRLSGPAVQHVFRSLTGKVPRERLATLMTVRHPKDTGTIDRGLCLFFEAPRSFTGEDMGEFQLHGGRAIVMRLLDALAQIEGLRPAEPGEFTRRAFLNAKLDLVEVEGLGDVISAETDAQLKLAQRLARGELSARVAHWRKELISAMSLVEADIDFSDEADVRTGIKTELGPRVEALLAEISAVLNDAGRGERLREGVMVAIAGPPNAGKSTLLNLLARRDAAIVSPIAGTTRDPVEVHLELGQVPVMLVDTAGLREGGDVVEVMGVARARERMQTSDLVLWLEPMNEEARGESVPGPNVLRVGTKHDLSIREPRPGEIAISAITGMGIDQLLASLVSRVQGLAGAEEGVLISRARQRAALRGCVAELRAVLVRYEEDGSGEPEIELKAEHLRLALRALGRLVGQVDVEEVLGEIFSAFCIGK